MAAAGPGQLKTTIPEDLEACSKEELVTLVNKLNQERMEISNELQRLSSRQQISSPPRKKHAPAQSPVTPPTETQRGKLIAKLARKTMSAIKKTMHSAAKKPHTHTEVSTGMDRLTAMSVLGQHGSEISSTPRSHRRGFTSQQALAWLQLPDIVSGVTCAKGDRAAAGEPPTARIENMEAKYADGMLTLRFRTQLILKDEAELATAPSRHE